MENLVDIQSRIAKLEEQAKVIRSREFDTTVQEILSKMTAFGITLKDLKAEPRTGPSRTSVATNKTAKSAKKKSGGVVAAKFRGPNNELWSGRGLMPRWRRAQLEQGKSKDDFLIKL